MFELESKWSWYGIPGENERKRERVADRKRKCGSRKKEEQEKKGSRVKANIKEMSKVLDYCMKGIKRKQIRIYEKRGGGGSLKKKKKSKAKAIR